MGKFAEVFIKTETVAPFAGAWIEIYFNYSIDNIFLVAPFAGAWIEIDELGQFEISCFVAPFAGA